MTANIGHQLDKIWNHPEDKFLGTPTRDYLDYISFHECFERLC